MDFSFSHVFASTHPGMGVRTIATVYHSFSNALQTRYSRTLNLFPHALVGALQLNVMIAFGVDAKRLNEYAFSEAGRFERIQFNCPFADGEEKASFDRPHTKALIAEFLQSASPLLDSKKGRLHISIQQPPDGSVAPGLWGKKEYQQAFGLTPRVAASAGLVFMKALGDIEKRYACKVIDKISVSDAAASSDAVTDGTPALPSYKPYIGKSVATRVNQFIFKPMDETFDYETDSGDSDDELIPLEDLDVDA